MRKNPKPTPRAPAGRIREAELEHMFATAHALWS
jgi:hypothetical protein